MKEKKLILIAEDEVALGRALSNRIAQEGYEVEVVGDGKECLEYVRNKKPDLLILDLLMPVVGGAVALKKIREDEDLKDLPIIVLSNSNDMEVVSEIMQLGVTDYLVKADSPIEVIMNKVNSKLRPASESEEK